MANFKFKIDKLNASNYITWKTVIKSQLMAKNLWDYILAIKTEEDDDIIKNEQAKSIMYAAMEPRQIAATGVCETAHALWVKTQENHEGAY